MSATHPYHRLCEQFNLAIENHDLPAAKRLAVKMFHYLRPGEPIEIWRADCIVRGAADHSGWDIP